VRPACQVVFGARPRGTSCDKCSPSCDQFTPDREIPAIRHIRLLLHVISGHAPRPLPERFGQPLPLDGLHNSARFAPMHTRPILGLDGNGRGQRAGAAAGRAGAVERLIAGRLSNIACMDAPAHRLKRPPLG
jgi:hypothetical protein